MCGVNDQHDSLTILLTNIDSILYQDSNFHIFFKTKVEHLEPKVFLAWWRQNVYIMYKH